MVTYEELERCLAKVGAEVEAAETHGGLCGVLCAVGEIEHADWLRMALGDEVDMDSVSPAQGKLIVDVSTQTQQALNSEELDFALLLPGDEEADVEDQVLALADWCRGFLYGLSHGGIQDIQSLPGDAAEVADDILAISQAGVEGMDREEAEEQLLELTEYVRMGVILINEEMQPMKAKPAATVH